VWCCCLVVVAVVDYCTFEGERRKAVITWFTLPEEGSNNSSLWQAHFAHLLLPSDSCIDASMKAFLEMLLEYCVTSR
jgi:hypothetical protein